MTLVIFDCDGVLIDSERLAVRTEAQILAELGWPLSEEEIVQRFVGRSESYMRDEVSRAIGRPVNWDHEFAPRYREVFAAELVPVEGVVEVLDALAFDTCVASSSSHEKLRFSLSLTGLYDRFAGRIFSAEEVAHGKPAPDLFLYAAQQMSFDPARCCVVEDSVAGVEAALAANMTVFGYSGSVTPADELRRAGAKVFSHMGELGELINEFASAN